MSSPDSSSVVFHRRALYSLPILHFALALILALCHDSFRVTCPIFQLVYPKPILRHYLLPSYHLLFDVWQAPRVVAHA